MVGRGWRTLQADPRLTTKPGDDGDYGDGGDYGDCGNVGDDGVGVDDVGADGKSEKFYITSKNLFWKSKFLLEIWTTWH